jgi:Xaa-Pro aminopeptidase
MEERHAGVSTAERLSRPEFSTEEYGRRLQATRRRMDDQGIDCLLVHSFPNICYLTGLETVAPHKYFMLAVPLKGEPVLLSQDFETHNVMLGACVSDVVAYGIESDHVAATRDLLVGRGWSGQRLGLEFDSRGVSETVAVTASGSEVLTGLPRALAVR